MVLLKMLFFALAFRIFMALLGCWQRECLESLDDGGHYFFFTRPRHSLSFSATSLSLRLYASSTKGRRRCSYTVHCAQKGLHARGYCERGRICHFKFVCCLRAFALILIIGTCGGGYSLISFFLFLTEWKDEVRYQFKPGSSSL